MAGVLEPAQLWLSRRGRELARVGAAALDRDRPVLAQIVPMRRCNLTCGYCNEYDNHSAPVETQSVERWIRHLGALGTAIVTISGGEPLLHPDLPALVAAIRAEGMVAGLISNGLLLNERRVAALSQAGLDHLQISVDNLHGNAVSRKSWSALEPRLASLSKATFDVNLNLVLGGGAGDHAELPELAERAREAGFTVTLGILHDERGGLAALSPAEVQAAASVRRGARGWTRTSGFQDALLAGQPNEWRCRAGARYLYVCEEGKVHYCSQRRGEPGVPLEQYTRAHIRAAFDEVKACAPRCTIGCVHRASSLDAFR